MKNLPSVFANNIQFGKGNNKLVYMSDQASDEKIEEKHVLPNKTVNQKINEIMRSKNNSYKIPVSITTEDGVVIKNIIGKNSKNLITIDNELIAITDIIDIKKTSF